MCCSGHCWSRPGRMFFFFFLFVCLFVLCVLLQRGTEMFAVYSDELDRALAPPAELHVRWKRSTSVCPRRWSPCEAAQSCPVRWAAMHTVILSTKDCSVFFFKFVFLFFFIYMDWNQIDVFVRRPVRQRHVGRRVTQSAWFLNEPPSTRPTGSCVYQ